MNARAHVIFSGRVQGVFFRDNTEHKAEELGVKGWVRNLRDGSVEAVMEGSRERVEELIAWCRTRQPHATVSEAKVSWEEFRGEFKGFSVRR
ncbi:MAG: acylphosphatase [Thermoplasmata archaeon]